MTELSFCERCLVGNMYQKPFPTVVEIWSAHKLPLVHTEVLGLVKTLSIGEALAPAPTDVNIKLLKRDGVNQQSCDCDLVPVYFQEPTLRRHSNSYRHRPSSGRCIEVVRKPHTKSCSCSKADSRYLKETAYLDLTHKKCANGKLTDYLDADRTGDLQTVIRLQEASVSQLSKKQAAVTLTTAEEEYKALSRTTQEVI